MKKIILLLAAALLVLVSETAVFAESAFVPYNSYTYDANEKPVYVPNAFSPEETVSGESMGVGAFLEPEDLFTGQDGRVYVLDTGNNRVVIADKTLSEGKALQDFTFNGVGQMLAAPRGLFVDEKGTLYICDTGNRRLVISDQNGTISRIIEKPSDREFPQDTEFEPEKIVVDKNGSMYVICSNIYQGAVVFSAEGAFEGYFGATKIQSSLQIIWQRFFQRFMTKEQKSKLPKYVPTEFENLTIQNDFIYTVAYESAAGGTDAQNAIRCLNPSGSNIINSEKPFGDLDTYYDKNIGDMVYSTFRDICVNEAGYMFAVDGTNSEIFIYDNNYNLLFVLGSTGNQMGTFRYPCAIDLQDDKLLVLDRGKNYFCVLEPTEFYNTVVTANDLFHAGMYEQALAPWNEVLRQCVNYSIAYDGIGKALFNSGDYAGAMRYFKMANNKEDYSEAFKYHRLTVIRDNFTWWFFTAAGVITVLVVAWKLIVPKLRPKLAGAAAHIPAGRRERAKTPFYCLLHPFEGFEEMREKNRASYLVSAVILAVFILISLISNETKGFIFNNFLPGEASFGTTFLQIVGIYLLWVVSSMALRTFLGGRARVRDVCAVISTLLIPLCFSMVTEILLSQVLTSDESSFLSWVSVIGILWAALLLIAGTKGINEYGMLRSIGAILLTLVFCCLILFLLILFYSSLQQVISLFSSIFSEFKYRYL